MTKRRGRYRMTPARRRALRKAQQASARKRFGAIKHDVTYWVAKGINKGSSAATFGASSAIANFHEFIKSSRKR